MAMLIPLDTLDDKELDKLIKKGGHIVLFEGKKYLRIRPEEYADDFEEDEND
jgi:hypothetical protein